MKQKLKQWLKKIFKIEENYNTIVNVDVYEKTPSDLFKGKIVVITGGGSGLGYYMAKKLSKEKAKVIIIGRNEEKLRKSSKEIKCDYEVFDVKDLDKTDELISRLYQKHGKIDILIHNAGISLHEGNMLNVTQEDFQNQFDTNLKGGYFLSQSYIKKYKEEKQTCGNIIFISSERGNQCDDVPYGLTKVSLNHLIEGMSRRFYMDGIRVNGVAPGVTASDMTGIKRDDNLYCTYNVSKRYFVPEEVAEVVCFLASDYSKCISGEIIHCDAGNHLNPWFK